MTHGYVGLKEPVNEFMPGSIIIKKDVQSRNRPSYDIVRHKRFFHSFEDMCNHILDLRLNHYEALMEPGTFIHIKFSS